ncbi:MAG: hypothetical protein JNM78_07830 [Cyclobacteriaceae bacterium]|nr:hypothetical protein [Cyclobacteriaceae bacterium]
MEIFVFKTSVEPEHVSGLSPFLDVLVGKGKWNFALDDCDRILRVRSGGIMPHQPIELLAKHGFKCTELE